ncbi:MAG TPA: hypothetical protein VGH73_07205 [Thermoanaerobaculia bacterium]|jgi:hypothetical protein
MTEPVDRDHLLKVMRRNFVFLPFCGDEARRWYSELLGTEPVDIRFKILEGFKALRNLDLESGATLLNEAERDLRRKDAERSSVLHYVERYRLTALAYLQYLNGDLEAAKLSLAQGYEEIRHLITCNRFLIPVAAECTDFIISNARIARRERQWREAERQIEFLRDIYLGRRPFCTLGSGEPVGRAEIRDFYAELPLSEEQRAEVHTSILGQDTTLSARIDQLEAQIYALPDMVIPYL